MIAVRTTRKDHAWMVPGQVLEQVPAVELAAWSHLYRQEEVRHAEVAAAMTSIPTVELPYQHEQSGT